MPEYQEILDSEVQPEAPLTSSLGVRFRDNPMAVWEGAAGAPRIQTDALSDSAVTQGKISSSAVGRSELRIGTNSVSGTLSPGAVQGISMTDYALFPSIHQSQASGGRLRVQANTTGSSASSNPKFTLENLDTNNSQDFSVAWRFIQS